MFKNRVRGQKQDENEPVTENKIIDNIPEKSL